LRCRETAPPFPATALGLAVLILMLGPVFGAHLNPVVSIADYFLGGTTSTGPPLP
jgi:glycerol uptake facilitator-like aquaporin